MTVILYFAQRRKRDADNLHYRVKGMLDGIKQFCIDDDTEHMELVVSARLGCPLPSIRKATEITMETVA